MSLFILGYLVSNLVQGLIRDTYPVRIVLY